MTHLDYGPNGGLVYCMEYLGNHLEWLEEQLGDYDEDYIVFDCPGQIELYSHLPVMRKIIARLQKWNYNICGLYLLDSLTVTDATRFISGVLMCLSAMVHLELPHINVLSKCDLLGDKSLIDKYNNPDMTTIIDELNAKTDKRFRGLNEAMGMLIEEYSMVSFIPLDASNPDTLEVVLQHVDHAIQYGEDMEPKSPKDEDEEKQ
eukprot:TRINITY_DN56630_c0_g1_i1.p1 TRINITY_DN56630_c0_g1~~TRINITY_DN56630_c0_g1_i1.p1  ORF type:complete len:204 (+),score=91.00 TRINITY_DN56630_c0_g1_i1:263-874(+)